MGIDTTVWIKKEDLPKILNELWDLFFLARAGYRRWGAFLDELELDTTAEEGLTSKDIAYHLMTYDGKIKDREEWARIVQEYDLLFLPSTVECKDKDRVELIEYLINLFEKEAERVDREIRRRKTK